MDKIYRLPTRKLVRLDAIVSIDCLQFEYTYGCQGCDALVLGATTAIICELVEQPIVAGMLGPDASGGYSTPAEYASQNKRISAERMAEANRNYQDFVDAWTKYHRSPTS